MNTNKKIKIKNKKKGFSEKLKSKCVGKLVTELFLLFWPFHKVTDILAFNFVCIWRCELGPILPVGKQKVSLWASYFAQIANSLWILFV